MHAPREVRFLQLLYTRHGKTFIPERHKNSAKRLLVLGAVLAGPILIATRFQRADAAGRPQRAIILAAKQSSSAKGESAVLAVDTLAVTVRARDNSRSLHDSFEQAAIQQIAAVQQTYRAWAQQKPELMGTLLMKLTVDDAGTVTRVDPLASRMSDHAFLDTVVADARKWKFPEGADSAEVTVPLFFVPRGMDPNSVVQWERNMSTTERTAIATNETAQSQTNSERKIDNSRNTHNAPVRPAEASRKSPTSPGSAEATRTSVVPAITNRPITLRDYPLFSAKKISSAETGAQVTILERRGDWVRLRVKDSGLSGFVRKEFVSPSN
ncbi:MAG TPA: AgmX/PglI C-terminal domain-containing protein [Candidatus Binatia bacterium]